MGDRGKVHFELARIFRAQRGWLVRIPVEDGSTLEFRYPTRRAARYFAAVFRLKPTWFPPPHAVIRPAPPPPALSPSQAAPRTRTAFTPERKLKLWIAGDSLVVNPGYSIVRAAAASPVIEPVGTPTPRFSGRQW